MKFTFLHRAPLAEPSSRLIVRRGREEHWRRLAEPALAARVDENIAAAEVELTSDDLREIDQALPQAQGARYSEANEKMIDR